MTTQKCETWTNAGGINQDCEGIQFDECRTCTRRKAKQLKDLVDITDPETGEKVKLFKCDELTANKNAKRDCPGEDYAECVFCTKNAKDYELR